MKKSLVVVVMLAMVLAGAVPALAQLAEDSALVEDSDVYPVPNRAFNCGFLNGDPSTVCIADEYGFFTAPSSGVRFPVGETDEDAYRAFIQYGGVPGSEPPPQPAS